MADCTFNWNLKKKFENFEDLGLDTSSMEFSRNMSTSISEHDCDSEVQKITGQSYRSSTFQLNKPKKDLVKNGLPDVAKFHIISLIL